MIADTSDMNETQALEMETQYTGYCILVAGMPASGKSSFAKWLSTEMAIPYMSKDTLKEMLFDEIGFRSRSEKVLLGKAAMEILYYFAENQMVVRHPVILENNFEDSSTDGLVRLLGKYHYLPVTVLFDGDEAVIYRRFLLRDQSPGRHRGHVTNIAYPETGEQAPYAPISFDAFKAGIESRGFRRFSVGGIDIRVDSTDFTQVDYRKIYADIKKALADSGFEI